MRICLYWNPTAGGGVSSDSLTELIARAGHHVDRVVEDANDLPDNLDASFDCVVAAGGDGTVARAGRILAGGNIPLAILPMGTANNIASSLAIEGEPGQLIAKWKDHRVVRIDVGVMDDGSGECRFLESVGTGLVVAGIAEGRATLAKNDPSTHLSEARQMYVDAVEQLKPHRLDITIDGESLGGDYLLIEVLNTPSIGPGIRFSAEVSPADGLLSVVAARESDREQLADYMRARLTGEPTDAGLRSWRAKCIELRGVTDLHVDDRVRPSKDVVSIAVQPASLPVLA
jgi:diacylglycerol kinase (ATP)